MATNSTAAGATRTSAGVLPAALAAIMVVVLALALAATVIPGLSAAPVGSIGWTERYATLAGMGGLPNPAQHAQSGTRDNLAGMGGLPNPAPRD